jgi:hypothetical protein
MKYKEEITCCKTCPAYSFHNEDDSNLPHHLCNLCAEYFPNTLNPVEDGFIAPDCPLKNKLK